MQWDHEWEPLMGAFKKVHFCSKFAVLDPLFSFPVCFTCALFLLNVSFSDLPHLLSEKGLQHDCRTNLANVYEFSNEKMGSKKRKINFFVKSTWKINVFRSYIYMDNKNIYKFMKNIKWKKLCLHLFNKKTSLYAGLGWKPQNF